MRFLSKFSSCIDIISRINSNFIELNATLKRNLATFHVIFATFADIFATLEKNLATFRFFQAFDENWIRVVV
ncbi:hypothetical protein WQ54_27275 [Bacillus sp. SA1-12]|nr:hypothetical protein WQ54_27275 [Bacillus sp. SA1-12]